MGQTVRRLTMMAETPGYRQAAGEVRQLGAATDELSKKIEAEEKIRERADRRLEARERRIRAEIRAAHELAAATKVYTAALEQGLITQERYDANMRLERQRFLPAARPPSTGPSAGWDRLSAIGRAEHDRLYTGSSGLGSGGHGGGWGRFGAMGAENLSLIQGNRRAEEMLRGMGSAGREASKGVALTSHEMVNLGYQLNDVGTMLAMGQSPLMILASQGGQVAQIFMGAQGGAVAAVKQLGTALLGFLSNPITLTVAALAAAGGAMAYFIGSGQKGVSRLDAAFEGHRRTINGLREGYGRVAAGIREVTAESEKLQRLRAENAKRTIQDEVQIQARTLMDQAGSIGRYRGVGERYTVSGRFAAFEPELQTLYQQQKTGTLDFDRFQRDVLTKMAQSPGARNAGQTLLDLAEKAGELQRRIPGAQQTVEAFNRTFMGDPFAAYEDGLGRLIDLVPRLRDAADHAKKVSDVQAAFRNARTAFETRQLSGDISPAQMSMGIEYAKKVRDEALTRIDDQRASSMPAAEQRRRAFDLEMRSINATTDAERALIAEDRKRLDLAGDPAFLAAERQLEAERAGKLSLAEATKRLADADRDRSLALKAQFETARADIAMLGQTTAAVEEERFRRERLAEIERDALQNGEAWARRQRDAVDDLAKTWGALAGKAAEAKAAFDLAFEAEQAGRSPAEREVFSRMQGFGLLQNGQIVGEGAQRIADTIRANAALQKQTDLTRDLAFEREQLFRTDAEGQIAERLRSMGIEAETAFGRYVSGAMRVTNALREARDMGRDMVTSIAGDLASGTGFKEAFASAAKRAGQQMAEQSAGALFDQAWGALGAATGLDKIPGFAGKPDGSSAARALYVQMVSGAGGATDLLGKAVNDTVTKLRGPGDISRSPLADVAPTAAAASNRVANAFDAGGWLKYSNQGATRNLPLDPKLTEAFSFLKEKGISMEVFSGGQPGIGSGGRRVGSTRHDHGMAADVFFSQNGRRLDWANPEDQPIFQDIVSRARANGVTGFGAGPGYMQPGSMHVGFGAPGVWGAGGRGSNAPSWLRNAYNAPALPDLKAANDNLSTFSKTAADSTGNLGTFGQGVGQLGNALGNAAGTAAGGDPLAGLLNVGVSLVGKIFGFERGGYTGAGAPDKAAGIVHANEIVWSRHDIARAGGVDVVEGMRRGLRGYEDGGHVGAAERSRSMPNVTPVRPAPDGRGGGSVQIGDTNITVQGNMDDAGMARLEKTLDARDRRLVAQIKRDQAESWREAG